MWYQIKQMLNLHKLVLLPAETNVPNKYRTRWAGKSWMALHVSSSTII